MVKKYQIIIMFSFLILMCGMIKVNSYVNELPLLGRVIYIDPGHGGVDPGANYKDIYEKNINLQISEILEGLLIENGAVVYLTREGDYDLAVPNAYLRKRSDLSRRVKMINESKCDIYLSIHLNATTSTTWKGAQVFYDDINKNNKVLGKYIQDSFKKNLYSNRKLKEVNNLYMYKDIDSPGVLLEVGFLSNQNERYVLKQQYYQKKISKAIIEGVINYFNR